jgi:hypothetical protein
MLKTYKAQSQLILPALKGGKIVYCEFTDQDNTFNTLDKQLQDYIEGSTMFALKYIILFATAKVENKVIPKQNIIPAVVIDPAIFPEITDFQDAADILKKEPYRIHYSKVKTPDQIKDQAELMKVSFPNLK